MRWTRLTRVVWLSGLAVGCATAIFVLWRAGNPALDPPPPDPTRWPAWAGSREPIDLVASISRLVATAALGYCTALAALVALAVVCRSSRLRRVAGRVSPGPLAALSALAVVGANPALASASAAPQPEPDPPVMRVIEDPQTATEEPPAVSDRPATTSTSTASTTSTGSTTTTAAPATTEAEVTGASPTTAAATPQGAPPDEKEASEQERTVESSADPTPATEYTVERGDSFWEIARRRVRLATGREPTDPEIRSYWVALGADNEDRLSDPEDPNLLFPGQTLRLPG